MIPQTATLIHRYGLAAAAVAAVLSPVPLADEALFLPGMGLLAARIGRAHGLGWRHLPWGPIGLTAATGLVARATLNLTTSLIPGVAAVVNAASALALTELFGDYVDGVCAHPEQARSRGLLELLPALRSRLSAELQITPQPS